MVNPQQSSPREMRPLRRVLILADVSANWKVGGLRQLERLALSFNEFALSNSTEVDIAILWAADVPEKRRWTPELSRVPAVNFASSAEEFLRDDSPIDLVVTTRLFLFRASVPDFVEALPQYWNATGFDRWPEAFADAVQTASEGRSDPPWDYLSRRGEAGRCVRRFLRQAGKSQDGLASRYVNRPISRAVSRLLLKLPITPTVWSTLIFVFPIVAVFFLVQGTYRGFVIGCAIFQLYSILDGCDGEIARARFLQSEAGRRLDSLFDLIGNLLLALALGVGVARMPQLTTAPWIYVAEGIVTAILILFSEGLLFIKRSRTPNVPAPAAHWKEALYQRHHEWVHRSGILYLGEEIAWWLLQLTKRDMIILGFLIIALLGFAPWTLHLLFIGAVGNSLLTGNAFLRHSPRVVPQEAS